MVEVPDCSISANTLPFDDSFHLFLHLCIRFKVYCSLRNLLVRSMVLFLQRRAQYAHAILIRCLLAAEAVEQYIYIYTYIGYLKSLYNFLQISY